MLVARISFFNRHLLFAWIVTCFWRCTLRWICNVL